MTHVKVAVRVRPFSERELALQSVSAISVENGKTIAVTNLKIPEQNTGDSRERIRRFTFDFCFEENSTQNEVFETIEKVIGNAISKRYHSCVLAYGQSSTGKTHTMMGVPDNPGITPRLCENIFSYLEQHACGYEIKDVNTRVSYLEIYNEKVRDLLVTNTESAQLSSSNLKIREHPKKGPYVQGLSEHTVLESQSLLEWLRVGNNNRRVAATSTNPHSSRSHSVFTVTCFDGVKLHLVDLAGSERAGSRCNSASRFREGANINKSLVALGNVISALAEKTIKSAKTSRKRFIPYRDSVLTWLLKDTLGGNSRTVMIATVSPSSTCYNETVNTLRFGQRAKLIISQPIVNEDPKDKTIRELRIEIARLKELLLIKQDSNSNQEDFAAVNLKNLTSLEDSDLNCSVTKNSDTSINNTTSQTVLNKTDQIIPIMNVNSSVSETKKKALNRTYSVDSSKINSKMQHSQENLSGTSTPKAEKLRRPLVPTNTTDLRKHSIDKPNLSLRNMLVKKAFEMAPKKMERGIVTEVKGPKIEAKVDSIRKSSVKPRSQIVAAVTSRLYSKVKKKEVATETEEMEMEKTEMPKELTICSNARLKLQELTRQALKANRKKSEETQTELFPVLRVKEISTDVVDLKYVSAEVKDVEIDANTVETKDVAVSCSFLENFDISGIVFAPHDYKNAFTITRSCGTQFSEDANAAKPIPEAYHPNPIPETYHPNPIKFTKYLQNPIEPRFEIVNSCTANPIYTTSVNINVSHNYINRSRPLDNVSDDSLEEQSQQNVCFPTPDLISNHNSLEPHTHAALNNQSDLNSSESTTSSEETTKRLQLEIHYAATNTVIEEFTTTQNFEPPLISEVCVANYTLTCPSCVERIQSINLPSVCATEICVVKDFVEDQCVSLTSSHVEPQKVKVTESLETSCNQCEFKEAVVLKSIMKQNPENEKYITENSIVYTTDSSDISIASEMELPDSLNYHKANRRRVHFTSRRGKNDRVMEAMSNFLEEAANLMTNLNMAASHIENKSRSPLPENYELQVTVNDITGLPKLKGKHKKSFKTRKRPAAEEFSLQTSSTIDSAECEDVEVQTSPKRTVEVSLGTDEIEIPVNKYESLVEESCNRLEEHINAIDGTRHVRSNSFDSDFLHRFPQPFEINPGWHREPEDSSLESNPTFSDYGSLPRRTRSGRARTTNCSPSTFLRQLTQMRQQIIESSREELNREANLNL